MKNRIIILMLFLSVNVYSQWVTQNSGTDSNIVQILFTNINTGYAIYARLYLPTAGKILKTTNGGTNWYTVAIFNSNTLLKLSFINPETGWVVGENNGWLPRAVVFRTTNGGIGWGQQYIDGFVSSFRDIKFINEYTGYCFGYLFNTYKSLVIKTIDGGNSWTRTDPLGTNHPIYNCSFVNENTGWISVNDYNNEIYKTTNGGNNWYLPTTITIPRVKSLFFINENTGWAAGAGIYLTTNGGSSWGNRDLNTSEFNSIVFTIPSFGWAVGSNGLIKYTNNSGLNWQTITGITTRNLNSVYFTDFNNGWISGDSGLILHTTNNAGLSAFTNIGLNISKEFHLSQNYPNPFNPQTKIKFDVPSNVKGQTSNVKLIIYDLLGREVTTLVNEELKPGTYEADWDGSSYSSGVFFYKLVAGDFTETKKMILMR